MLSNQWLSCAAAGATLAKGSPDGVGWVPAAREFTRACDVATEPIGVPITRGAETIATRRSWINSKCSARVACAINIETNKGCVNSCEAL